MPDCSFRQYGLGSLEPIEVFHQTALQVCRFVLVYVVAFCKAIYHTYQLREKLSRIPVIRNGPVIFNSGTGRFLVITVTQTANCQLTHPFLSGLMICHKVVFLNGGQRYKHFSYCETL